MSAVSRSKLETFVPPTVRQRAMTSRLLGFQVLLLGGLAAVAACTPPTEEGTFVVRLGTDTTAVERYTLEDERIHVLTASRSPRALLREAVLEVHDDGRLARFEVRTFDPTANGDEPLERRVIRYEAEEAEVEVTDEDGEVETRRVSADPYATPFSPDHFSLKEVAIRRAIAQDLDAFDLLLDDGAIPVALHRPAEDQVELRTGPLGVWTARVDPDGRILELDAGALGRQVERVTDVDVEEMARRFAEEDERGEGMGPLSPRETEEFQVHGARISVEYGRPAQRGREIFGGLVPYGEVWRTGADVATELETDRTLVFDGERLPAGRYSIFTVPEVDEWTLLVNEETGQPGTEHDPDRDLLELSLQVEHVDPPEERFTILVQEDGAESVLRFRWADTEAWIPFQVE